MDLLFYSIHQSDRIKMYNSSVLNETELESMINNEYARGSIHGETSASEFRRLYNLQVNKGKNAIANYDFFIKHQLINAKLPCIFSMPKETSPITRDTKGIAIKFAALKTDKDIFDFAKEYGLLGVLMADFRTPDYGPTIFEPIYFWKFYINEINKLLKLYKMLKKKHKNQQVDIIGELINYKERKESSEFEWSEGGPIPMNYDEKELSDFDYEHYDEIMGAHIFTTLIRNGLKGAINIDFSDVVISKESEIGFRVKEVYSTNYLLGAIYYDLWQLVSNNIEIQFCAHCGKSFTKFGRKKYCSDSCKSLAWMDRKKGRE